MSPEPYTVAIVDFALFEADIRSVRNEVFVKEQSVPVPEEWDGLDPDCFHALARDPVGRPIGTARLLPGGKIGRMAVLTSWRGRSVGSQLLGTLMELARGQGSETVTVDAQLGALPFYERHGFEAEGPVFLDAGIEHRRMSRAL